MEKIYITDLDKYADVIDKISEPLLNSDKFADLQRDVLLTETLLPQLICNEILKDNTEKKDYEITVAPLNIVIYLRYNESDLKEIQNVNGYFYSIEHI